jgi:hypothetical protein
MTNRQKKFREDALHKEGFDSGYRAGNSDGIKEGTGEGIKLVLKAILEIINDDSP